jgi:hypothetical protein
LIKQQVILSDFLGTNDEIYIGAQAGGSWRIMRQGSLTFVGLTAAFLFSWVQADGTYYVIPWLSSFRVSYYIRHGRLHHAAPWLNCGRVIRNLESQQRGSQVTLFFFGHYSNITNIGISFLQDPGKFQRSGEGCIISDAWDRYRFQKS